LDRTQVEDLAPVLQLPKLKRLTVGWRTQAKSKNASGARRAHERVIALLEKRGVSVEVTWP